MNKKLLIALAAIGSIALSSSVCAMRTPNLYLGGQLGWGNTDYDVHQAFKHTHVKGAHDNGVAGRAYAGFQFNPFLGLETGLAAFSDVDLPQHLGNIKTLQWDLLAKVGTPFGDSHFRGDLKGGAAKIFADFDAGRTAHDNEIHSKSHDVVRPVAGASLSYDFCNNVYMDLSYLHAFGDVDSGSKNFSPNTDLVTLGLSVAFPM